MRRMLTHDEAKAYYDASVGFQDKQGWYEDAAIALLRENGALDKASNVLEFGCGTGKLAQALLHEELPATARYTGLDISGEMIALASERLAEFGSRAEARQTTGSVAFEMADEAVDRFIACYVLDLLSPDDTAKFVAEAHRILVPGGLLCLASLTKGRTLPSRMVSGIWSGVHRLNPKLVGGCRPIDMGPLLPPSDWTLRFSKVVSPYGISSEVVIAARK